MQSRWLGSVVLCFCGAAALASLGCSGGGGRASPTAAAASGATAAPSPGATGAPASGSTAAPAAGSTAVPASGSTAAPASASTAAPASGSTGNALPVALGPLFATVGVTTATLPGGDAIDVYYPAPPNLAPGAGWAFPAAVLLQGAQVDKAHYAPLASQVAAHGFVVIAPNHLQPVINAFYPHVGLVNEALDWLRAEAVRPGSPLQGAVDTRRIAALGHSYGGLAALRALSDDNGLPTAWPGFSRPPELACAVVFATKTALIGPPAPVANQGLPVCMIQGELDRKTTLDEAWATFRGIADPPAALVTVLGAGHFLASDVDDPPGAVPDPATPTLPQADAVATAARWAAWFLRAHLSGDQAAWEAIYVAGARPDPGVQVAAVVPPPAAARFVEHVVDAAPGVRGPAYATATDLDRDGVPELVVSSFGAFGWPIPPGEVAVYRRTGGLDSWRREVALPASAGVQFPNRVTPLDVDGDGDLDLVVTAGFLATEAIPLLGSPSGRLLWLEATPGGWARHDVTPVGPLFFHLAVPGDVDRDGTLDLITVGERKAPFAPEEAHPLWFRGDPALPSRFEAAPRSLGSGLGSFPELRDLDGDGDQDLAGAEFFLPGGSYAWFERLAHPGPATPAGSWQRHVIDDSSGPALQLLFVPDLQGDGVLRALGSNHVGTGDPQPAEVVALDIPADPRARWGKRTISRGIRARPGSAFAPSAAPGLVATGDLDGDGDRDVVVCGDGDPRVLWLEQLRPGEFVTHVLIASLGQAGGLEVVDLDGDGRSEVVLTGYEDDRVLVFSR